MKPAAKILVVDDNPVARMNLVYLLRGDGYDVAEAATGNDGRRLAREWRPDMILLDVMLPDANGKELCQELKSAPGLSPLFVVLISSIDVSGEGQAVGLDAGADGYIARPIGNRELRSRIQALLRLQQAEAALRQAQGQLEERVSERTAALSAANERLRTLSARLLEVQETERRYVARELHDEIGQLLTGLKLTLELAEPGASESTRPRLRESITLVEELMSRARQLSLNLRPQMLDDLGLIPALEFHFKRFTEQTGLQVQFQHSPMDRRLSPEIETGLFRIAQEALTNAARHARVTELRVRLWKDAHVCRLQVQDHGAGFDVPAALAAYRSHGLAGMSERTVLLGGELTVESAPGQGTCLTLEIPLNPASG
jgi:signal transduction histidine kinase